MIITLMFVNVMFAIHRQRVASNHWKAADRPESRPPSQSSKSGDDGDDDGDDDKGCPPFKKVQFF